MIRALSALNPWVILAAVVAFGGALWGAYSYGTSVGKAKTEVKWQKRELEINAESTKKIIAANARVRDVERKSADSMASVSKAYQESLLENKNAKNRAIAGVRAGTVRLYDASQRASCGNAMPAIGTGPGGRDDSGRSEFFESPAGVLSDRASEFLIEEAGRADAIVAKLKACQEVVMADRAVFP